MCRLTPSSALIALALASALACGHAHQTDRKGPRTITVAAVWPWSARHDFNYGEGLELAVDEINAAGGIGGRPVRVERHDDHESVDEGRLIAQQLVKDSSVLAVIGHLHSYVTVPAAAVYDLAGLPLVAPTSTDPQLTTQGYQHVFRTIFTDRQSGREMADYAAARGYHTIAIYYVRSDYGRALANAFEEEANARDLHVVDRQSYDPEAVTSDRTFEDVVNDWKRRRLDAIFIAGQVPEAATFVGEVGRQGLRAAVLGGDALGGPALTSLGHAAEGVVVPTPFPPDAPWSAAAHMRAAFARRYGHEPDAAAALGYDAMMLLADAMRRARSLDRAGVTSALRATHEWPGVTGLMSFDARGDLIRPSISLMAVHGGAFVYLPDRGREVSDASR
jgi:branched-chain amino acid transport system substrate-binding protein